jgi:hypothetical protein
VTEYAGVPLMESISEGLIALFNEGHALINVVKALASIISVSNSLTEKYTDVVHDSLRGFFVRLMR